MARAAYLVLHRARRRSTGRHTKAVEAASRLLFVGVEAGSFVQLLALPEVVPPGADGFDLDVADLGMEAFDRVVSVIERPAEDLDRELALAISQLADGLDVGGRTTSVSLARTGTDLPTAVIDAPVRERMRLLSGTSISRPDELVTGQLVEADFEHNSARLRTPTGSAVAVAFQADMADDIQRALRGVAELRGHITYDPRTGEARSVELKRVAREEQLMLFLGGGDIDEHLTVEQLQLEQGIDGPPDLSGLYLEDWTEDERDAYAAALADA